MSEEHGLKVVVQFTDELMHLCNLLEITKHCPPELVLASLVKVTRVYADKCSVSLDKVMKALETAG